MTTEERLEKVERELADAKRRIRWALGGAGLAVALLVLPWLIPTSTGKAPDQGKKKGHTIRATKFELVDEKDRLRGELCVDTTGSTLALLDERGQDRVIILSAFKSAPGLVLSDEKGNTRTELNGGTIGPGMRVYDETGMVRVALGMSRGGSMLTLYSTNRIPRATLAVEPTQTPDGKAITNSQSSLLLYGPEGTITWQSPR